MSEPIDLGTYADGDLEALRTQLQGEYARRAAEGAQEAADRRTREIAEVRSGERRARSEHVAAMSPAEITQLADNGGFTHLGIGPRRKRSR